MGSAPRGLGQGVVEPVAVAFGVIALERRVVPVAVEGGPELLRAAPEWRSTRGERSTPHRRAGPRARGCSTRRMPCRSRCCVETATPWRGGGYAARRTGPRTSAPKSLTRRSRAARSVAPMYVVVMMRRGTPRSRSSRSSVSIRRMPCHLTKAMMTSTRSALGISARSSCPMPGSPEALVRRAASESGVAGRRVDRCGPWPPA